MKSIIQKVFGIFLEEMSEPKKKLCKCEEPDATQVHFSTWGLPKIHYVTCSKCDGVIEELSLMDTIEVE